MKLFRKKSPAIGRVSHIPNYSSLSPNSSWRTNLLHQLKMTPDAASAIALLEKEHPDMSMAISNLIYLSNQGHSIEFYNGDLRLLDAEAEWFIFSQRINSISSNGLDGLVDAFHKSSFTRSGMAFEVVVNKSATDIEDVYLIDPMSINWKLENRNGRDIYIPYQFVGSKSVDLSIGNFFWFPFDPPVGSPIGSLMLQSAVGAIEQQLELYQSLSTVLFRIGTPRYDIKIDTQRVADSAPSDVKNNPSKLRDFMNNTFQSVRLAFSNMGVKTDFVHSDDTSVNIVGGGNGMSGVDARAFQVIADTQVLNGTHQMGVLMNRYDSKTNALSSTEFKIMINKLDARRRDSKRAVEAIANLWLRVKGYSAVAKFTHNPIEWETMLNKFDALLKKQEFHRRAEEYLWQSGDIAAMSAMGISKSDHLQSTKGVEYVKIVQE